MFKAKVMNTRFSFNGTLNADNVCSLAAGLLGDGSISIVSREVVCELVNMIVVLI